MCIVAVCTCTKFVVLHPISRRTAAVLAQWFYADIITEYGVPRFVRTDNGTEFLGDFSDLLRALQVMHVHGPAYHTQSNG